jgi:hypothetical protein
VVGWGGQWELQPLASAQGQRQWQQLWLSELQRIQEPLCPAQCQ